NVVDRVRILTTARGEAEQIGEVEVEAAIERLLALEDDRWGGIGDAPKFPHESDLLLAADRALRTADARLVGFVDRALDAMARGGIFDQVGGGFHRYATDAAWRVPHFEKMLYNQALLARVYLAGYRLTGRPSFLRVARQTLDYVLAEMTAPDGAFYSATDADSEGEEGRYFLWTPAELSRVLGEEEGAWAAVLFGATDEGHLEGRSVLHLPRPLAEVAVAEGVSEEELLARVDRVRRRLYAARSRREPPLRDDKVVTAWNGLMVAALAEASTVLGERYADAAARAADALWAGSRQPDGRLFRIRLDGEASVAGLLEDYAYLAEGLVALYDAAGDERWLERAVELSETMRRDFWDQEHGGFFVTAAAGAETLITRPRSPRDGALPSANSVALRVLLQAWRRDGSPALRTRADALVRSFSGAIASSPPSFPYLLLAWAERDELQVGPHAYAARGRVTARVRLEPGGAGPVWGLDLRIADGWHINSNAPLQDELVATAFESAGDGWEPVVVAYPPGHLESLGFQNEPLSVYSGQLTLSGGLRRQAADADPVTTLRLRLQACDDRACLRPELLEVRLPLASALGTDAAWPAEASNSDSGARPAPLN
ncbi:MAG: thioredoxin, partial [Thermoanaerobaculia bacterium]|nr:thioredoxin [Thermoanaerobaculia bacterium]